MTGIASKTYTGSAQTQDPTVKVDGRTLANGTDYTLSYSNNTNAVTGYSIAMSDASAARGTTLSMAETASSGLQRFYLAETSMVNAPFDGTKSVRAAKDKTFGLNIASASKTDGANVNLYKYSNANEKKFRIMYSGGYYRLVNVIVKTAAATMAQRWYLQ